MVVVASMSIGLHTASSANVLFDGSPLQRTYCRARNSR